MEIKLNRCRHYPKETIGQFRFGGHFCYSLENTKKIIPVGRYLVKLTWSPKFGTKLPLLCDVKGRRGIRIHAGNSYRDTSGCILLGHHDPLHGERISHSRYLYNSKYALTQFISFMEHHENEDIYLTIV